MNLEHRIEHTRLRAGEWLKSIETPSGGFGVSKCSNHHNISQYPGMQLPATYNAVNCKVLLGVYDNINSLDREALVEFINSFQREEGIYRIPEMSENDVFKINDINYTWEYIDFHTTNYSMGAIKNIQGHMKYDFKFMDKYLSVAALEKWFDNRIMSDPWLEGNNIVNLASFYIYLLEEGKTEVAALLEYMLKWHDHYVDPETGFWGTNLKENPASKLFGMAGAAHNYHIYFYFNKPIQYADRVIDYCIDYAKKGIKSACLDVDVVDILANMCVYNYRKQEIINVLEEMLHHLLRFQNEDGGFNDERMGIRRFDGWVRGYWEPQGISNCFATWFRCATIGMISCILFPEKKKEWTFRNTIGIGYYNKDYNPFK